MTDTELLKKFSESPHDAYGLIIGEYGSYVYAIAANKLHTAAASEDIEDCVSDIFVEVFGSLDKLSPSKGSLKTFIGTIAKRTAIDAYRRISYRQGANMPLDDTDESIPDTGGNIEEKIADKLYSEKLREAVMSLGEPDSSIIIHQYFYNHTIPETARILSLSVGAVQQRSLRARKRIKKLLEKEG